MIRPAALPAVCVCAALVFACLTAAPRAGAMTAFAQTQRASQAAASTSRLTIDVRDTLGGLLPGATVTITGPLPDTAATNLVTDGAGKAEVAELAPGRYSLRVELAGFQTASAEVTLAAGASVRRTVSLPLERYAEKVTVKVDATERRLADNFTETLTPEEIEQLPDDPDEAAALIAELAGPDAEIRVNGFEGGELPPKSQIQAIRVRHDPFAPDSQGAGRPRVDIITKPGTSGWEHHFNAGLRDESIDARNPFAQERGEGQTRRLRWSSSGPLIKGRTSLAVRLSTRNTVDVQPIVATRPGGTTRDAISQQSRGLNADVRVEHGLSDAHTLRVEYQRRAGERHNLGVGEFSLRERAYDTSDDAHRLRVSDIGTFGKRAFNELRFELTSAADERTSRSAGVTIDVANAFTAGGAQLGGGTRAYEIEARNDLELALGDGHKVRLGFEGEYARVRSDQTENANGRFIFPSLEAFAAGRPIQFVQRVGDPSIAYSGFELGWYLYDELRLRPNIQLGLGLRHQIQSFTTDWANFGPRASIAWTPTALPGTTVRAGAGVFYDSYDGSLHERTLRLDGTRQRDLIVTDPGWPDPFTSAGGVEMPPPSIVRASADLRLPTTRRISVGVERSLTDAIQLRANVFHQSTRNRLRSLDVNAPIDGRRPNPALARVTEIRSIGRAEQRGLDVSLRTRARQLFGTVRYRYARELDDADGTLALPADNANLAAEWGPAAGDIRHRLFGYMRLRLPHGIGLGLSGRISSGRPYTVRTGFDDNNDQVPNDRPAGVGRNSERGEWHAVANMRLGWTLRGGGDGGGFRESGGRDTGRGVEIYTQVANLFNTTNFTRYGSVLTSRYFGLPTAAQSARRMEFGLRVFF